ncbi:winged helix-turn-helix domain-containing protein [Serratia marcescens]|uniref:winged helix-turn-helix domain-containing protein n=2 Tax=Serratia TaxID=613 RepID=UPI0014614FE2|nr:winged helix-turn-helix domain-containing protein [Serratia marcescens]MBH3191433.1 winged helix-turn-helix domain-containing protein [Serratia marcescens]MBN5254070.1 winged helix-turn-helix domain-containing protein [Serratia marcescens]NMQ39730.1 winged helix-turn-helix transcriptional regulator [Serratia marcescens]
MSYLIMKRVEFDYINHKLISLSDDSTDIELTPIVNKLLFVLIAEQGKTLTKDYLLNKVWEDVGRVGSMNTLNQYLSYLRKLTKEIFLTDVIITLPGEGYTFSSEIEVSSMEAIEKKNIIQTSLPWLFIGSLIFSFLKRNLMSIFCFIFFMFCLFYLLRINIGLESLRTTNLKKINECTVLSFNNIPNSKMDDYLKMVQKDIFELDGKTCNKNDYFLIYYNPEWYITNVPSYSMIAKCSTVNTGKEYCITFQRYR